MAQKTNLWDMVYLDIYAFYFALFPDLYITLKTVFIFIFSFKNINKDK